MMSCGGVWTRNSTNSLIPPSKDSMDGANGGQSGHGDRSAVMRLTGDMTAQGGPADTATPRRDE